MKSVLFSLVFLFTSFFPRSTKELSWHTELETAQAEAISNQQSILMVFSGSDWCKPCIRLKQEVFESQEFKEYAQDRWSLLNVDFPRSRKNKLPQEIKDYRNGLAEKYNPKGYFPLVLVLDKEGNIQQELSYKGGGPASFLSNLD